MTDIKFVPPEIIGERMKIKEKECATYYQLHPWQYGILRFDGHSFSKFTSGFEKPFDNHMAEAMQFTLMDVINTFNPILGYVQSDEISIVFAPYYQNKEEFDTSEIKKYHSFNGKKDKLISIIASYISVRFNYHIINSMRNLDDVQLSKYKPKFIELINRCQQHFDGRMIVFEADELSEVLNYFVWRKNDCLRNCISSYARHVYGPKKIMHCKFNELVSLLDASKYKIDKIDSKYKYGVFAKKELYGKDAIDIKTNEPIKVTRTRVTVQTLDIMATPDYNHLVLQRYWNKE